MEANSNEVAAVKSLRMVVGGSEWLKEAEKLEMYKHLQALYVEVKAKELALPEHMEASVLDCFSDLYSAIAIPKENAPAALEAIIDSLIR